MAPPDRTANMNTTSVAAMAEFSGRPNSGIVGNPMSRQQHVERYQGAHEDSRTQPRGVRFWCGDSAAEPSPPASTPSEES
jgi:hypothetical protein